ncbi:hypothetical protein CHCC20441_0961 [Bacillus licheniformis]|nr:hypothetical protein B4092_0905 [Bacillus licheniformis]TWN18830.1 hypothetical protein CHCC14564_2887 [Bacillus licheniformis LMG 17339]TWJ36483.1 hypothetical protein CHCC5026_3819 [Bacillus licheniformis]TWJ39699.1 hypothetical protein CHCC5025_2610 [Bacillus licheniformis]TWJ46427.1 hypothetical protein CHCC5024_3488 [Bacillus licheniformis]
MRNGKVKLSCENGRRRSQIRFSPDDKDLLPFARTYQGNGFDCGGGVWPLTISPDASSLAAALVSGKIELM